MFCVGKKGYHGVGEHSWDVANGLLHLFVTLEAPPSPLSQIIKLLCQSHNTRSLCESYIIGNIKYTSAAVSQLMCMYCTF